MGGQIPESDVGLWGLSPDPDDPEGDGEQVLRWAATEFRDGAPTEMDGVPLPRLSDEEALEFFLAGVVLWELASLL